MSKKLDLYLSTGYNILPRRHASFYFGKVVSAVTSPPEADDNYQVLCMVQMGTIYLFCIPSHCVWDVNEIGLFS